jgi:hypothetical protein
MCRVIKNKNKEVCAATGLEITMENDLGSFCNRMCGFDASLFSKMQAARFIEEMGPIFPSTFEGDDEPIDFS